ncbi:MAG: toxin-antitoxin system TumE family protein [Anaerolineae bacterium]
MRFDRRVLGWDNAPHHPGIANFPHHFHREDSSIGSSDFTGKPDQDIDHIITAVNEILSR